MAAPSRRSRSRRRAGRIFGKNLRQACAARGIDAAQLAQLTKRSRRSVERMLAGQSNPTVLLLMQIARSIEVPLAELVRDL